MEAIELFGPNGYYFFFRTLEIMGREFKTKTPGYNDFSMQFFQKKFKISDKKLKKLLQFYKTKNRIFYKIYREKNGRKSQERIKLNCPKLRISYDEYTQRIIKGKKIKTKKKNRDIPRSKIGSIETEHRIQNKIKECVTRPSAGQDFKKSGYLKSVGKFGINNSNEFFNKIIFKCETIREFSEKYKKKINVYAWVQKSLNQNGHPDAIDESLDALINKWQEGDFVTSPWPYLEATFQLKNGNYWEDHHVQESQKFKNIWIEDETIQEMVGKIGKEI